MLSTAVEEFQELDLIFKSGSDLDVVERGYGRKLIDAIGSQNEVLECEAIKSLGDLYLHKARIKQHKAENFKRACALYKELLRFYKSNDEKEVVQRRIKYAEKCTKLVDDVESSRLRTENPNSTTLAVSATLQERTKIKAGHGMMPLVEAYTNTLVTSIVDRNKRMEIESLKGIGDLYLERGMVCRDETEIAKSVGLYRAALDRCEDSDGRETLRHRIKYAEKVKEKGCKKAKKRLDTGPTQNKEGGNDNRLKSPPMSYHDHLQEGCRALQTGDLDTAEQHFAAALKSVHVKESNPGEHWKEVEPLCKLTDVYLKRGIQSKDGGDFTKAAALCNAALVRAKKEDRKAIKQRIQKITQAFVTEVMGIEHTVAFHDAKKHKSMLMENRGFVEEEIKRIEQQADPYCLDDNDPKIRDVEKKRVKEIKVLLETIAHQRRTFISGLVDECIEVMGPPPCEYAIIGLGSQATGLVTPYSDLEFAILIQKETENSVNYFHNLTHYLHLLVINLGETILPAMAIKSLNDFESGNMVDNWFYDSVTPRGFSFDGAMPHACKTPLGRAVSLNNMGAVWQSLGDCRKAIIYYEQSLQINQSIYGEGVAHLGIARLLNNLGTPWSGLGDHRKAISYHEQALQMMRTIYGERTAHLDIATSLTRLGNAWKKLGVNRKAISYHEQSLQMARIIYGEKTAHPAIANSLNSLGAIWRDLGDHRKAVDYYEQALQMMGSVRGEKTAHPLIAAILNNLGSVWMLLGDYTKATLYHEQSMQMMQSSYGENTAHPDIAALLSNLGGFWCSLGDHEKAVSCIGQSLQMMRSIYGESAAHPDIASSLNNLGVVWREAGDHGKASRYFDKAKQMKQKMECYKP
uniref:Protein-PII uridylyltransferase N-terminal domain-containing protein n=1 Tax=Branchiostoma floridae TaxID=7739 RepID=C3YA85_BRAFL|eukprot:XP_002606623.1 hypothetical protein BRAFLDRAFT_72628 [Branchiostoma floridae]